MCEGFGEFEGIILSHYALSNDEIINPSPARLRQRTGLVELVLVLVFFKKLVHSWATSMLNGYQFLKLLLLVASSRNK